jgi:hypothetical protein
VAGINGSGMHMNISMSSLMETPLLPARDALSSRYEFAKNVMRYARDICLALNSSVNSYRRLDPAFELQTRSRCPAGTGVSWFAYRRVTCAVLYRGTFGCARCQPVLGHIRLAPGRHWDYESQPVSMEGVLPATISRHWTISTTASRF